MLAFEKQQWIKKAKHLTVLIRKYKYLRRLRLSICLQCFYCFGCAILGPCANDVRVFLLCWLCVCIKSWMLNATSSFYFVKLIYCKLLSVPQWLFGIVAKWSKVEEILYTEQHNIKIYSYCHAAGSISDETI